MVIGCQPEHISAPNVEMGLTKSVENAIPKAIEMILKEIGVS
jgi:coenzyme F420 hydrogenase subunit delta